MFTIAEGEGKVVGGGRQTDKKRVGGGKIEGKVRTSSW